MQDFNKSSKIRRRFCKAVSQIRPLEKKNSKEFEIGSRVNVRPNLRDFDLTKPLRRS